MCGGQKKKPQTLDSSSYTSRVASWLISRWHAISLSIISSEISRQSEKKKKIKKILLIIPFHLKVVKRCTCMA